MSLQIHQWYSIEEIWADFANTGPSQVLCDGEFVSFPSAIACLFTLDPTNPTSRFESVSRFRWRPQRLDYVTAETIRWFPEAARETWSTDRRQRLKQHHLFTKTPSDEHYFYVGPVYLTSYGGLDGGLSAIFSLTTVLSRSL